MTEQIINDVIAHSLAQTALNAKHETADAYTQGARMMYNFLQLNRHLLEPDEAEKFFEYCRGDLSIRAVFSTLPT